MKLNWCCVPVIVDDDTTELFLMPAPDEVAEQQPAFCVTESTADLVSQDFARSQLAAHGRGLARSESASNARQESPEANRRLMNGRRIL